MGWREQVHIGELTVDTLIMSDATIPGDQNACIAIDKDAAYGIALTGAYTTNGIKVNQGSLKIHLHNQTAQTYCGEFKFDAQGATGIVYGIDVTCEIEPGGSTPASRTSGGLRALQGVARVQTGFTLTGGTDMAVYGQFVNLGTLNGASLYPTVGYFIMGNGGTWTQVGVGSVLWLDTHMAQTVSAGSMYFLNITHNGTATPTTFDAAVHVYGGNAITNLLKIDTASGMVSANTSGGSTLNFSNYKTIKIDLDGTTHYLVAAQTIA